MKKLLLALGLAGCARDDVVEVELAVVRLLDAGVIDDDPRAVRCDGDEALLDRFDLPERCTEDDDPACTCELSAGHDTLRVLAAYAGFEVTNTLATPAPAFSLLINGEASAPVNTGWTSLVEPDGTRPAWSRPLRLDRADTRELAVRVTSDTSASIAMLQAESATLPVQAPTLALTVEGCEAPCTLPAGMGSASVTLRAPRHLTGTLTVEETVDGLAHRTSSSPITTLTDGATGARFALPVPAEPGSVWQITGRLPSAAPSAVEVTLGEPSPLEIAIVEPGEEPTEDAFAGARPERLLGDRSGCRSADLVVRGDDLPQGATVTVTVAGPGNIHLGAGLTSRTLTLTRADQTVRSTLEWEARAGTLGPVTLTASATHLDQAVAHWVIGEVAPASATLVPALTELEVDGDGAPALQLTGQLSPPALAAFTAAPDARVLVRVSDDGAPLSCVRRFDAVELSCDPDLGLTGCALTPQPVVISSTGALSVQLTAGACLSGTATVQLVGRRLDDAAPGCLYEQATSGEVVLATATVRYRAP